MKIKDLFSISIGNLIRRKLRTALTILGVVIGTASVVIMLSIGYGISIATEKALEEEGSLTAIDVSIDEYSSSKDKDKEREVQYLDDKMIEKLKKIKHIESISPILSVGVMVKQGRWEGYITINGSDDRYLKAIPLGSGELPQSTDQKMRILYGNGIPNYFFDAKSTSMDMSVPDIDLYKTLFMTFEDTGLSGETEGENSNAKPPKKYVFETAGVVEGEVDSYNTYAYGAYTHIDSLIRQLRKVYRNKPIPGQPTTKRGKPLKFIVYNSLVVNVDHMDHVTEVQKKIMEMGLMAETNVEWIQQAKKQTQMLQGMLGGIGLVSLVVAAIGIANTMMMSIYERTKEIGIMKVLGCDMNRIRDMFLLESGLIGLFGGLIGIGISYLLSYIANRLPALQEFFATTEAISVIPNWLGIIAVFFAIVIGMLAGFMPSLRAMQLSPLAALRNE